MLPLLPRFSERFPKMRIELHLSNRNIDFTGEGFDLAIRGRAPPDSGLIARKLEDADLVLVAAPAYLARAGKPDSLEALAAHECIQFLLPSTGQPVPWLFRRDGQEHRARDAAELIYPNRRHTPLRVRAFIDFLITELRIPAP